jgi:hypothetical protein
MKNSNFTLEHALYTLAILLALGIRLLKLGALPLSDFEAAWALQALHVAQGLHPALDPNPAYIQLTAILFYIFGGTEFLARLWPALIGSARVGVPFFFRSRLGRLPSLVLAFGLAVDPGLSAISRLAGGSMLAVAFLMLAWAMWEQAHRSAAGVFGGLALLSGPSVWFGLLGLGLTWLLGRVLLHREGGVRAQADTTVGAGGPTPAGEETRVEASGVAPAGEETRVEVSGVAPAGEETRVEASGAAPAGAETGVGNSGASSAGLSWAALRPALVWAVGTVLVVGSLVLLSPKGLAAFVAAIPAFLSGWLALPDIPAAYVLVSLPAYELLPLLFGLVGVVRAVRRQDPLSMRLGLWALVSLVLTLIYPNKQVASLTWMLLPLWALAALELSHHFDFEGQAVWELTAVIALIEVLLVFGLLNLAAMTTGSLTADATRSRLYLEVLVFVLIALSLLLAGLGWSPDVARLGAVWAGMLFLTAYTIAVMTGATGVREPLTAELWQPEPRTAGADLILKVANQISDLNRGNLQSLPVTVVGVDSPSLLWVFRNWDLRVVNALAPEDTPELVITPANTQLSHTVSYRGEGFAWRETPSWAAATSADWLRWFVYHQMTVQHDEIILWVRADLLLDPVGQTSSP